MTTSATLEARPLIPGKTGRSRLAEHEAEIKKLWDEGQPAPAIGDRYGVTGHAIRAFAKRKGWKRAAGLTGWQAASLGRAAARAERARKESLRGSVAPMIRKIGRGVSGEELNR